MRFTRLALGLTLLAAAPGFGQTPASTSNPYGLDPYKPSDAAILREYAGALLAHTPLLELSKCPDFVVNRGHYFGTDKLAEEPGLSDPQKRDLQLETCAVDIYRVKIEIAAAWVLHVGGEDDSFAIRKEVRTKVRFTIARDLPFV